MAMSNASTSTLNQDKRELGSLVTVKVSKKQEGRKDAWEKKVCPTLNISWFLLLCSIDFSLFENKRERKKRDGKVAFPMSSSNITVQSVTAPSNSSYSFYID